MIKIIKYPMFHQLDPDVGGYASAHIELDGKLEVLTTPVNLKRQDQHHLDLEAKIEDYAKATGNQVAWLAPRAS